jgi:hypothetical protein
MIQYSFEKCDYFFRTTTFDAIEKVGPSFNLSPVTYPVTYLESKDIKSFRYSFILASNPSTNLDPLYYRLGPLNEKKIKILIKKNKIFLHMNLIYSIDTDLLTSIDIPNLVSHINKDFKNIENVFTKLEKVKNQLLLTILKFQ